MLSIKNGFKNFTINNKLLPVLEDINLQVQKGEFVAIVGHSGCGKSTLLRIIAGLNQFNSGSVLFKNKEITKPNIERGMIFQENRLLPWLTIADNIAFGLDHIDKKTKKILVENYLKLVNLTEFANAYPKQLSGGMAQRAAIARTIITQPELLLLDEPLGALDALTKIEMQREILSIKQEKQLTMILVTHDIEEAIYLGNRVIIMSSRPGNIKKIIDINLPYPRNRGSSDFAYYKRIILQEFFDNSAELFASEYEI
ncbi:MULTISPECIES: ABC transporter ATP-binding protein [Providencia]|nr:MULTISPECIES: ABC transporter ATP-binding protein [Providencia]MCD2529417.1 ABC transporter ATP-binding protein [Providencia huaxiensis]MCG9535494.1 ABC transporter ATP-binding protein [Providencia huaxiensis]MDI7241493.1 ABC transporter ATP-binding protein [Providencia huaxiensis]MDT0132132.1 ABC transporter ATP-binding protein [Providencia huaxiensis]MDT1978538.1 ABC transporter ATP-binding protein [Providencia huaxiensis]